MVNAHSSSEGALNIVRPTWEVFTASSDGMSDPSPPIRWPLPACTFGCQKTARFFILLVVMGTMTLLAGIILHLVAAGFVSAELA